MVDGEDDRLAKLQVGVMFDVLGKRDVGEVDVSCHFDELEELDGLGELDVFDGSDGIDKLSGFAGLDGIDRLDGVDVCSGEFGDTDSSC
jgi:hypothetical protein